VKSERRSIYSTVEMRRLKRCARDAHSVWTLDRHVWIEVSNCLLLVLYFCTVAHLRVWERTSVVVISCVTYFQLAADFFLVCVIALNSLHCFDTVDWTSCPKILFWDPGPALINSRT